MLRAWFFVLAVCLTACASGPDPYLPSQEKQAVIGGQPAAMLPVLNATYSEGEWGAVLNLSRLGLAALDKGYRGLAETSLDQSLARIETVYANDPAAEKARSLWAAEGVKDFKGEPYERAMAYYYRGLLYMANGDYQNARAVFKNAEYQDTLSEAETFQGDFGMMTALAGWASKCDGDESLAANYYKRAQQQQAGIQVPARGANTLVIVESGGSPVKAASGKYGEELRILTSPYSGPVSVKVGNADAVLFGDVAYQASTRGGRQVDKILEGKASFKETASTVGKVSVTTSLVTLDAASKISDSGNPYAAEAGLVMLGVSAVSGLVGLTANIVSSATIPKADSRYWENLPSQIRVAYLSTGTQKSSKLDVVAEGRKQEPVLDEWAGACRVVLYRLGTPAPAGVAPGNMTMKEKQSILDRNQQRDQQFRAGLQEMLALASASSSGQEEAKSVPVPPREPQFPPVAEAPSEPAAEPAPEAAP